jgi:hypothetical protein
MRLLAAAVLTAASLAATPARALEGAPRLSLAASPGPSATLLGTQASSTGPHLVGALRADDAFAGGGDGKQAPDPVVALILGIIPGFGLGHWYAGDPNFITWTIVDAIFLVGAIIITVAVDLGALVWIAWLAEHGVQGYLAHQYASGHGKGTPKLKGASLVPGTEPPARDAGTAPLLGFAF